MDNMGKEYRRILNDLDENLKDNPDLEYVKSEFTNLFMLFFNEIDSLRELYENKIEIILDRQSAFDEKLNKLEERSNEFGNELNSNCIEDSLNNDDFRSFREDYSKDEEFEDLEKLEEDTDLEAVCPYCNKVFGINSEIIEDDVECPHCHNFVEIDWEDSEN